MDENPYKPPFSPSEVRELSTVRGVVIGFFAGIGFAHVIIHLVKLGELLMMGASAP